MGDGIWEHGNMGKGNGVSSTPPAGLEESKSKENEHEGKWEEMRDVCTGKWMNGCVAECSAAPQPPRLGVEDCNSFA